MAPGIPSPRSGNPAAISVRQDGGRATVGRQHAVAPAGDQAEIIAFLSRPESYAADAGPVERIDTHISVVFLVGERAYKLKRAVKFGYLDYSTAERRRRFCEQEVAVNRRTAERMYLGTVPVSREPDGRLMLDGRGEPVDWLVVMRRFDQDTLFDRLALRGGLGDSLILDLADVIADFHRAAAPRDGGGAASMRRVLDGNGDEISRRVPETFPVRTATRYGAACERALRRTASLLDDRARGGLVRHCHGDLHLRNICLVEGRPTLFDAIEFNDALTDIDVLYDLAFLIMDLEHRGLRPAANLLFNRYLGAAGDYDGLAAMPLFLACRAGIRAHTAAAAAAAQPDAATARRHRDEARAYLDLGLDFLRPMPARLVAVGGLSGSGKSDLAGALAPHLGRAPGALHLQSDVTRKRLFGQQPEAALSADAYAPAVTRDVYGRLRDGAAGALAAGHPVIVDATYMDPDERAAIREVADAEGVPFTGLWLEARPDILESRVGSRGPGVSDATVSVVREQFAQSLGDMEWTRLSAEGAPSATLARAREFLAGEGLCRPANPDIE